MYNYIQIPTRYNLCLYKMSALKLDTYKAEGCWYKGDHFSVLLVELIYNPSICNMKPEVFLSSNNDYCLFLCKKIERVISIEIPNSNHPNLLNFELLEGSETEPTHLLANFGQQGTYYITASGRIDRSQHTAILSLLYNNLFEKKHLLSDKTRQAIETFLQKPNDHKDQPSESKDDDEDADSQEDDTNEDSDTENSDEDEPPLFKILKDFMDENQRKQDARQEIYNAFGFDTKDEEEQYNEEEEEEENDNEDK